MVYSLVFLDIRWGHAIVILAFFLEFKIVVVI